MKNHADRVFQVGICLFATAVPMLAGTITPVPEPSTVLLLGGGLGALILLARKKRSQK